MKTKGNNTASQKRDVTDDLLLCNRCGSCRSVCPLYAVYKEEWASARGKVELAEAFLRGEDVDARQFQKIFDLCLHCMSCEEHCPSGMRADEVVMAVRAEMARRGLMPRMKRLGLKALEGMDNLLFKLMRTFGAVRRESLHGLYAKGPLSILYPLVGWPRDRFVPLPKDKPFLGSGREFFEAGGIEIDFPDREDLRRLETPRACIYDRTKTEELIERVSSARWCNLTSGKTAYYFIGHAVNHFFPEEAEAIVRVLNVLGVNVLIPDDQVCCGAPIFYAGDIAGARRAAATSLEKFAGRSYDWIVTSCSTGGLMLKEEFPRLFDLTADGFFEIEWDPVVETFRRIPGASTMQHQYPEAADMYNEYIKDKVFDVNELIVHLLELKEGAGGYGAFFGREGVWEQGVDGAVGGEETDCADAPSPKDEEYKGTDVHGETSAGLPVVTYHHPCHLKRGQGVEWQPETILKNLPGYRYVQMADADRCCGGGGAFTFIHSKAADAVAEHKMKAIEAVRPDIVATACPICRVQLMDMLHRRQRRAATVRIGEFPNIPVTTPVELLLENLQEILEVRWEKRE